MWPKISAFHALVAFIASNSKEKTMTENPNQESVAKKADPWKHRSEGMSCATCMWSVAKVVRSSQGENPSILGRCRRRAPTLNGYPAIFATDWCGDHKLDENAV